MNKRLRLIQLLSLTFILTAIMLSNCGDKKKAPRSPRIRKLSKVVSPKNGLMTRLGDSIKFEVSTNQDTLAIDSFIVRTGNKLVFDSNKPEVLHDAFFKAGKQNFAFTVFLNNGNKETHNRRLTFLSGLEPNRYTYRKVNTYPHDPDAFIQGLYYDDDFLYESTGHKGESTLRKVEIKSGKILEKIDIDQDYFGEGITPIGNEIFMLTWQARKGFVFNKADFSMIREFEFPTEGWGLTTIGDSLVMSIGSEELIFIEPTSFTETGRIQVYDQNGPVGPLNELEFVDGDIYANVYQTDDIVIIDPMTGQVKGRIDLEGIFNKQNYGRRIDVLNGIAYDKEKDRLFVTGKWWPKLYEIDLVTFQKPTI